MTKNTKKFPKKTCIILLFIIECRSTADLRTEKIE